MSEEGPEVGDSGKYEKSSRDGRHTPQVEDPPPIARAAKIDPRCLMEAVAMGAASGYRLAYEGDWPEHSTKEEAEEIRKIARM